MIVDDLEIELEVFGVDWAPLLPPPILLIESFFMFLSSISSKFFEKLRSGRRLAWSSPDVLGLKSPKSEVQNQNLVEPSVALSRSWGSLNVLKEAILMILASIGYLDQDDGLWRSVEDQRRVITLEDHNLKSKFFFRSSNRRLEKKWKRDSLILKFLTRLLQATKNLTDRLWSNLIKKICSEEASRPLR
jgi:hypothetical protein